MACGMPALHRQKTTHTHTLTIKIFSSSIEIMIIYNKSATRLQNRVKLIIISVKHLININKFITYTIHLWFACSSETPTRYMLAPIRDNDSNITGSNLSIPIMNETIAATMRVT